MIYEAYTNRELKTMTEDEAKELNKNYSTLFSSQLGQIVLKHLVSTNLTVPIATKGDELLDIGVKQGRANIVDEILQRIQRGERGL